MNRLKITSLLFIGKAEDKVYFEEYFRSVKLLKSTEQVLEEHSKNFFSTIFLDCTSNKEEIFSICQKIREYDHKTIIVLIIDELNTQDLLKLLPLHITGYITSPFETEKIENLLSKIAHDLEFLSENTVQFNEGVHFHIQEEVLHDALHNEIKLTKNELKLLNILAQAKGKLVTEESIEHALWEEESFEVDCSNRLKNLLYNLRKKLPKNTISNNYKLGYRLIHI